MRTALIIPYNPLEETGGLELGTVRLASSIIQSGNSAEIVTLGISGRAMGVPVVGLRDFIELCRYLLAGEGKFDIIHWMEIFPNPADAVTQGLLSGLLRSFGKKIVLMVATSGNLRNRGSGPLLTPLIRNAVDSYVISNPDQFQEFAEAGITSNIRIIGFGIDTQNIFTPATQSEKTGLRKKLKLPEDKVLCLFIGRFVERKRPDFLLNCWRRVNDLHNTAELIIVGSGMGQHDSIEHRLGELTKTTPHATFRDITPNPEDYYRCCDMLLLPSNREGQPNVLMEMMACGNPVIGSDIAGIREFLNHDVSGLLFQPNDEDQFMQSIRRLVSNRGLRSHLGKAAREKIIREKSQVIVTDQYLQLYQELKGRETC